MKACTYCGRENEDATVQCRECGTEMQSPNVSKSGALPKPKILFRQAAHFIWLAAVIVVLQALIPLSATSSHPDYGDGNPERIEAAGYFWKSVGIAIVLVATGCYLRSRRKVQHVD